MVINYILNKGYCRIQILSRGKAQREALEKYLGDLAPKELIDENNDVDTEDAMGPSSPMEHELRAFVSATIGGWLFLVT